MTRFWEVLLTAGSIWFLSGIAAQSFKHYPLELEGNPSLTFPAVEGAQYQYMGDAWFFTAKVTGKKTGKDYQVVTIFNRNYITAVILNFYQVSIFDYSSGEFNTFTQYDLPGISLVDMKFRAAAGHLDIGFNSSAGDAHWTTARGADKKLLPFQYKLHCPGVDHVTGSPFAFSLNADMQKKPVAYGAADLAGVFTFFSQKNTLTYFQPGPSVTGSLEFNGVAENFTGTQGHIDRQIFPLYSGIFTPTGRQHSHEWRQINLDNGIDLAIWRQFARTNGNKVIATSGTTTSYPPPAPLANSPRPGWATALPDDLTVEYESYAKYPRANYSTLIPPPSANMYLPSTHVIRSKKLRMELRATYITATPVAQLPIEYFEGPAHWVGTYEGKSVTGVGIFESSLALYRDWELAGVLLDSVSHLPAAVFDAEQGRDRIVDLARELAQMVGLGVGEDHRVRAGRFAKRRVIPALRTLTGQRARATMLEIARDFVASLALVT